jgi:hypothetical protein
MIADIARHSGSAAAACSRCLPLVYFASLAGFTVGVGLATNFTFATGLAAPLALAYFAVPLLIGAALAAGLFAILLLHWALRMVQLLVGLPIFLLYSGLRWLLSAGRYAPGEPEDVWWLR